ncbi:MAG: hypothetical protein HYV97_08485 [Bdellovibrio sp.]|nr:hypothetical protein [Bdellovibrio sp.]
MRTIFFCCTIFALLLPAQAALADDLQFPDDLPAPKEFMDGFFKPMEQLSFAMARFFTITWRGQDCRQYNSSMGPLEFTACIQNIHKNGRWLQRLTYFLSRNLPLSIIIEHTEPGAISNNDLWNWRFPLPKGTYYSFSIPVLGLSALFEQDQKGITFKISYAQEDLTFLETAPNPQKITRIYQGSFFEKFHDCQVTVISHNELTLAYYQIDQGEAMAPYLFRRQCLSAIQEQLQGGSEHLIARIKQHVSVD